MLTSWWYWIINCPDIFLLKIACLCNFSQTIPFCVLSFLPSLLFLPRNNVTITIEYLAVTGKWGNDWIFAWLYRFFQVKANLAPAVVYRVKNKWSWFVGKKTWCVEFPSLLRCLIPFALGFRGGCHNYSILQYNDLVRFDLVSSACVRGINPSLIILCLKGIIEPTSNKLDRVSQWGQCMKNTNPLIPP